MIILYEFYYKCFIDHAGTGHNEEAIITAILAMGHSLGLNVVAEGIESAEQIEFLRDAGCDVIQGFFVSRPVGAEAATVFLTNAIKTNHSVPVWTQV